MNILMVSANIPSPTWGASSRNYYLLQALASRHSITLLALGEPDEKASHNDYTPLENLTRSIHLIAPQKSSPKRRQQLLYLMVGKSYEMKTHTLDQIQEAIDNLLCHNTYDLILYESVLMANYHISSPNMKVIIDQHNIEHELLMRTYQQETALLRKWYNRLESSRLKPIELELCRKADMVFVTSEREKQVLLEMLPGGNIVVLPNGVNLEIFNGPASVEEIPGRIVFTGSMDYYPNVQAVLHFAQYCWPYIHEKVPHASWHIVGRNPLPTIRKLSEAPGITVTGWVADTRPYLAEAQVVIAPLLIGSGTRLKILEAWAMGKAIVTTKQGYEGLAATPDVHLLEADKPDAFAQAVIEVMNNPAKRTSLGNAGRALAEASYSWVHCGKQLLHALETNFSEKECIC